MAGHVEYGSIPQHAPAALDHRLRPQIWLISKSFYWRSRHHQRIDLLQHPVIGLTQRPAHILRLRIETSVVVAVEKTADEQHQFQGRWQIITLRLAETAQGAGQASIVITSKVITDAVGIHQRAGPFSNKTPNDAVGLTMSRHRHFLNLDAESRQYLNRPAYGGVHIGFRAGQAEPFSQHAKTNTLQAAAKRLRIRFDFDFSLPWIHRVFARDYFEHQRDIGNSPAHRSSMVESRVDTNAAGVWHEPMRWLQSDHS